MYSMRPDEASYRNHAEQIRPTLLTTTEDYARKLVMQEVRVLKRTNQKIRLVGLTGVHVSLLTPEQTETLTDIRAALTFEMAPGAAVYCVKVYSSSVADSKAYLHRIYVELPAGQPHAPENIVTLNTAQEFARKTEARHVPRNPGKKYMSKAERLALVTLLLAACATFTSCVSDYAPPELYQASVLQGEALDTVERNQITIVDAYHKELLAAYDKQLNLIEQIALGDAEKGRQIQVGTDEAGKPLYAVPRNVVDDISADKAKRRAEIVQMLETKRTQFNADPALQIARDLNDAQTRWLKAFQEDFIERIDYLTREGQALLKGDEEK